MEYQRLENIIDELVDETSNCDSNPLPWNVPVPLCNVAYITADFSGELESVINVQWGDTPYKIDKSKNPCSTLMGGAGMVVEFSPVFYDEHGVPIPSTMYDKQCPPPLHDNNTNTYTYKFGAGLAQEPIGPPPDKIGITIVVQEIVDPVVHGMP